MVLLGLIPFRNVGSGFFFPPPNNETGVMFLASTRIGLAELLIRRAGMNGNGNGPRDAAAAAPFAVVLLLMESKVSSIVSAVPPVQSTFLFIHSNFFSLFRNLFVPLFRFFSFLPHRPVPKCKLVAILFSGLAL